jgi:hypothetical protein
VTAEGGAFIETSRSSVLTMLIELKLRAMGAPPLDRRHGQMESQIPSGDDN